ncbi:MAG: tRNA pseudouridine(55) synthase TruB [Lachnospiraceae bacterium]|jgi:tRNA pseudouridine55 synthase|nr:tRNA pseudouridine(55) synthase TruB [Lachnospiraceae bacterium]
MINGIINVYKEKGFTSHDVVAKLRGILRQKKIGHTGTLDPEAEGVLPVCLGKATRVCDMLTEKDKVYEAQLLLGTATDTQDTTGTVQSRRPVTCSQEEAEKAILSFVGEYDQLPPMYSALKVNGKKLCDLARAGIEVERKPRTVTIFSIRILELSLPRVRMEVHCSKGTYIRTLCHDIGEALGCGGCMESLLRTRAAGFVLEDARKLGEIEELVHSVRAGGRIQPEERAGSQVQPEEKAGGRIQPENTVSSQRELTEEDLPELVKHTDYVFRQYPEVSVKPEFRKLLLNGNPLKPQWMTAWKPEYQETVFRVYDECGVFTGIYQWEESRKDIRPVKILR